MSHKVSTHNNSKNSNDKLKRRNPAPIIIYIASHEGGHYIFGKLSCWQFVSFRVGKTLFL
ncbi:MAG: hypothetical protein PHR78_03185 [Eubacteriales bacterium]|nr:hypothetical protein [Eubacteriales bacterium]MDD4324629.1 hypothetical protein [Eubacteriales bacterium]MDD4541157.1 hypothetical protein [Eubacteriales bacterium]